MKMDGVGETSMASSKSFIKLNSQYEPQNSDRRLDRLDSMRGSASDFMGEDILGPLNNVRFAVFALGSSAYPNFCAFGKYLDNLLIELGSERLMKLATGDEMCAQEQVFAKWAAEVFNVACEAFCLDEDDAFLDSTGIFSSQTISDKTVRLVEANVPEPLETALAYSHNKKVSTAILLRKENLHGDEKNGASLAIALETERDYEPGDHVGVFPCNRPEIVDGILEQLDGISDPDAPMVLQNLKENHTPNGVVENWEKHPRLPKASIRTMLTRFLDLTTPPSPNLLEYLASVASDPRDRDRLKELAKDTTAYEDWRHSRYPHLLEVLHEFRSVKPKASLLLAQLNPLQPRFYSISSSPLAHPGEIHMTVAVVRYLTEFRQQSAFHYGVCSNYLNDTEVADQLYIFVRSAPSFHLPKAMDVPLILVGPGTGIAPFRGFWHHRKALMKEIADDPTYEDKSVGSVWLFFGCRNNALDLYKVEKEEMVNEHVLDRVFLALSREPSIPKTYVQDIIQKEKESIYRMIVEEKGHFYVCGDCTMAEHVYQTLKSILQELGRKTEQDVEKYLLSMRDENRYHEDIFGITLRTAEVHNRSRESARMRLASHSST